MLAQVGGGFAIKPSKSVSKASNCGGRYFRVYAPGEDLRIKLFTFFFPTALVVTPNINIIVPVCTSRRHCRMYTQVCTVTPQGGGSGGGLS